jgi:hypothetical protein
MLKKQYSSKEDNMTGEILLSRFKNQFDLVRYAIKRAENRILSGHDYAHPTSQNLASEILKEITEGKEVDSEEENNESPEEISETESSNE